jgi:lysophospholipase L1-like esterase
MIAKHRSVRVSWWRRVTAGVIGGVVTAATVWSSASPATGLTLAPRAPAPAAVATPDDGRVGTWSTAVTGSATAPVPAIFFENQTLRQIVHTSVAGRSVRVRLSNEFGTEPLRIGEAHVALRAGTSGTAILPGSDRMLTFGGRSSVTIPAGAPALSDPVALRVPALRDLAVSLYLPERTRAATLHGSAFERNFIVAGNATSSTSLQSPTVTTSWYFLSGASVAVSPDAASIVALGDSITDGAISTVGTNHRWTDFLARRLQARAGLDQLGVLNKGIGGNRLLHNGNTRPGTPFAGIGPLFGESALARFDRDVLAQPGARYVIVLLGINDIGHPTSVAPPSEAVTVREMIAGYQQLIARAHERGLRIYGATLTPFKRTTIPGYYTFTGELKRQAINRWIRTSGAWDGVIDFDKAVRDPEHPRRMLPRYDSGDHLHPNDAGMRAMAHAIPLRLFRATSAKSGTPMTAVSQ